MFEAMGLAVALVLTSPGDDHIASGQDAAPAVTVGCGDAAFEARYPEAQGLCPLADAGNAEAQSRLGVMYLTGRGLPQDSFEALRWFRLAAAQGDPYGQHGLAVLYDGSAALRRDEDEAIRLYRLAAEQGLAVSQDTLGGRYEMGFGVPKDPVEAARWYRLAADQGLMSAQVSLAILLETGQGVAQDDVEAYKWYLLAAASGGRMFSDLPDEVAARLTPDQLAEGRRRAAAWRPSPRSPSGR